MTTVQGLQPQISSLMLVRFSYNSFEVLTFQVIIYDFCPQHPRPAPRLRKSVVPGSGTVPLDKKPIPFVLPSPSGHMSSLGSGERGSLHRLLPRTSKARQCHSHQIGFYNHLTWASDEHASISDVFPEERQRLKGMRFE